MKAEEKKQLYSELWNQIYDATTLDEIDNIEDRIDDIDCARILSRKAIDSLNECAMDKRNEIEGRA